MTDLGPWYSPADAAPLLGLSVRQVQVLCSMREIPHKREGRRILIPEWAIKARNRNLMEVS